MTLTHRPQSIKMKTTYLLLILPFFILSFHLFCQSSFCHFISFVNLHFVISSLLSSPFSASACRFPTFNLEGFLSGRLKNKIIAWNLVLLVKVAGKLIYDLFSMLSMCGRYHMDGGVYYPLFSTFMTLFTHPLSWLIKTSDAGSRYRCGRVSRGV